MNDFSEGHQGLDNGRGKRAVQQKLLQRRPVYKKPRWAENRQKRPTACSQKSLIFQTPYQSLGCNEGRREIWFAMKLLS